MTALPPFALKPWFRAPRRDRIRAVSMPAPHPRSEYHQPVLLAEIVGLLAPGPGRFFVDGTLGGGGHSAAFLAAGAGVLGLDQDGDAIAEATTRLAAAGKNFRAVRSNFSRVGAVLDGLGIAAIDGALLDLGVSSHQLDDPARGFSFQTEGPLDMRMDTRQPRTAADLVNTLGGEELEKIFRTYGEEPAARRIAARLVRDRLARPFTTTLQLAAAVESVVPRHGRAHPATRVFQALRISVNGESEALEAGLAQFSARLAVGGRFGVITFQSGEDRVVKHYFKARTTEWLDRPSGPRRAAIPTAFSDSSPARPSPPARMKYAPIRAPAAPSSASWSASRAMYHNHRRFENVVPIARFVIGISVVLFIAGACIFYVWSCNEIDAGGRQIKKLENRLTELHNQNETVQGRVAVLSSIATLNQSFKSGTIKLDPIQHYEPAYRIAGDDEDVVRPVSNSNRSPRP